MQSKATTVDGYLAELPEDRRSALQAVRKTILRNLDKDFEEGMQYGMIGYYVPHRVFPAGYHCDPSKPLPFAALASQKNYMSVYLMGVYGDGEQAKWFHSAWSKTGKKLDMGKCCVRFKKLEDLAIEVVGEAVRRVTAKGYIARYEALLNDPAGRSGTARKPAPKKKTAPQKTAPRAKARTSAKSARSTTAKR